MKTIVVVFGEMGCGKTYWSKQFAERYGYPFFDGDTVLTPEMLELVVKFKPIPLPVLEAYMDRLFSSIIDEGNKLSKNDSLIVAQALYRDQDRIKLKSILESYGFRVEMLWLRTGLWNHVKNLLTRANSLKWCYYWLLNKPFFQKPTHDHKVIVNVYEE